MQQGPLKSSGDGDGHSRTLASRLRRLRSPNKEQNTPKPPRQIGTRSKRERGAVPAQDQAGTLAPAPTSMTVAPARVPTPTHPPLAQALQRARKKFYKMDVDRNGVLEGPELLAIANWIWLSFHPGGTQVSAREKESDEMLLLRRLDGNGVMNFDEFGSWFESACTRIEQGRYAARAHQGLERTLAATDTPVEDHSITQTLAQALERARNKFYKMDMNRNGVLEAPELLAIANWMWLSFHPGGQPMSTQDKGAAAATLMLRLDRSANGVMDFDEFSGWFESACTRQQKQQQEQIAEQENTALGTTAQKQLPVQVLCDSRDNHVREVDNHNENSNKRDQLTSSCQVSTDNASPLCCNSPISEDFDSPQKSLLNQMELVTQMQDNIVADLSSLSPEVHQAIPKGNLQEATRSELSSELSEANASKIEQLEQELASLKEYVANLEGVSISPKSQGVAGIDDAKICELKNQIASQHQVLQELLPQADAITSHLMAEADTESEENWPHQQFTQALHTLRAKDDQAAVEGLQLAKETLKKQVAAASTHKFALEHEVVWLTAEKQKLLDQKLTLSALSEDSSSADDQVMHLRAKLAQFTTRHNESSAKRTGLQKILLHQRKRCEVVADAMVAVFTGTLEQKVNSPATESRLSPPSISHETLSQEEKLAKQIISILSGTSADSY